MSVGNDKANSIISRGRRESGSGGNTMGYNGPDARSVRGDHEAPHLKVPPFPTPLFRDYFDGVLSDTETVLEPIAVAAYRSLVLYVIFTPGEEEQSLRIRLEAEAENNAWFPTAVIDGTLDLSDAPIARRNLYLSELVLTADAEVRVAIPYEVGFYETVRFVVDGEVEAAVNLAYRLSL